MQCRAGCRLDRAGRASGDRGGRDGDSDTGARARDRVATGAHHCANGRPDDGTAFDRSGPNDRANAEPRQVNDPDRDRDNRPDGDRDNSPDGDGDGDNGPHRRGDTEPGGSSNCTSDHAHNETDRDADAAFTFPDPNTVTGANGLTKANPFTVSEAELAAADRADRESEWQGRPVVRDRRLSDRSRRGQDRAQLRWRG
jgi:hypothetical protein